MNASFTMKQHQTNKKKELYPKSHTATPNDPHVLSNIHIYVLHPENAAQHKFNKLTLILSVMSDVAQCHVTINCTLNETVYSGVCIPCSCHTIWRRSVWYFSYLFLRAYFDAIVLLHLQRCATIRYCLFGLTINYIYIIILCAHHCLTHLNALAPDK